MKSYQIRNVLIDEMTETKEYQREYKPGKEQALAEHFDENAAQQVLLSRRSNGKLVIIDGRHTVHAAASKGIKALNAKIVDGLTIRDEARLFRFRNTLRANPKNIEVFFARLVEKEPIALEIMEICRNCSFTVSKKCGVAFSTKASAALEETFKIGREHLERVLNLIGEIWPEENRNGEARLITGLSYFLRRVNPDEKLLRRIVEKLSLVPILVIFRAAKGKQEMDGRNAREAIACVMLDQVNKGRRENNKLSFNHSGPPTDE